MFVPGRYMAPPRVRTYIVPLYRRTVLLRATRVVNRTRPVQGARLAVNPGISPSFVTRVSGAPIATYRVRPRVFAATQGVTGAVQVRREELGGPGVPRGPVGAGARPGIGPPRLGAISVQRTNTVFSRAPQRRRRSRSARTSPASWAHTRHAPHKARHPQYRPRDQHHLSRLALRIGTSTRAGAERSTVATEYCAADSAAGAPPATQASAATASTGAAAATTGAARSAFVSAAGKCGRQPWHMRHRQRRPARLHRLLPRSRRRSQVRSRRRKSTETQFN
jgi:hypothetical protein